MSLRIRDFTPDDYEAALAVHAAAEPEYPMTLDEWRHWDTHHDAKIRWARFVAEQDGAAVAVGSYEQPSDQYHPRKFHLSLTVHPAFERQGIGTTLYDHVCRAVEPFQPVQLNLETREDRPGAIRFIQNRGFVERMREWESRLDLAAFDPGEFAEAAGRAEAEGIELRTFRQLQEDSDWARKLHALKTVLDRDVPSVDEVTETDFEVWLKRTLDNPGLLPDGWIVAVHNGEYVGESSIFASQGGEFLEVGLTAVRREYRRRGIALALKVRATAYGAALARSGPYRELRTWNATTNEPMLALNGRLGFKRLPAWIFYSRQEGAL